MKLSRLRVFLRANFGDFHPFDLSRYTIGCNLFFLSSLALQPGEYKGQGYSLINLIGFAILCLCLGCAFSVLIYLEVKIGLYNNAVKCFL